MLLCIPMFVGCATDTSYIMTSDGKKYPSGPYIFYAYFMRDSYDMQYYTYYKTRLADVLNEKISEDKYFYQSMNEMIQEQYIAYVLVSEKFDEFGLKLTSDEIAAIDKQYTDNYINVYGATKFDEMLKKMNLTVNEFKDLLSINAKNDAITQYYFGSGGEFEVTDTQERNYFSENYARLKSLIVYKTDSDGKALTTAELIEKDNLVKSIIEQLDGGASFEELIAQHSDAYTREFSDDITDEQKESAEKYNQSLVEDGMITDKKGIYNTLLYNYYGYTLDSTIVDYIFSAEIGDYKLIELSDSYWIVKKYDSTEKNDYFADKEKEIFNALTADQISLIYQTWKNALVVEYNQETLTKYDVRNLDPMFIDIDSQTSQK